MSRSPKAGQFATISFRFNGDGKRVKTSPCQVKIAAVYADKTDTGYNVQLVTGDSVHVKDVEGRWVATH